MKMKICDVILSPETFYFTFFNNKIKKNIFIFFHLQFSIKMILEGVSIVCTEKFFYKKNWKLFICYVVFIFFLLAAYLHLLALVF